MKSADEVDELHAAYDHLLAAIALMRPSWYKKGVKAQAAALQSLTVLCVLKEAEKSLDKTIDPKIVEWLADELTWPFECRINGVPECYIEPIAAHYQAGEGTETSQEWIDAIRTELRK